VPDEEDSKHAAGSHNESASGAELSAATRTGNSLAERPRPSRPARYSRHQLKTKLALTPCARATRATDALRQSFLDNLQLRFQRSELSLTCRISAGLMKLATKPIFLNLSVTTQKSTSTVWRNGCRKMAGTNADFGFELLKGDPIIYSN